jgi:S-DNA-T family DNA segregation ATPase FtsK/SpoIIIE
MANTLKNKKAAAPPQANALAPLNIDKKRQTRLGFGIFFMLSGIFTCLSIISYCFTWTIDQDSLISKAGLWNFLLHDHTQVANWGGRLGATISHILVYDGAGLASLAIGLGIAAIGLSMIYGKRALPLLRYMRWISIVLLLIAPILTFLFPLSSFPLGGALGKVAIEYLTGLIGTLGTGMALLSTVLFFVFVIFALDVRPFLHKMRQHAKRVSAALAPQPVFNSSSAGPEVASSPEAPAEDMPVLPPPAEKGPNQLNNKAENIPLVITDTRSAKQWDMAVTEKEAKETPAPQIISDSTIAPKEDIEIEDEEFEDYKKFSEERSAHLNTGNIPDKPVEDEEDDTNPGAPEFSFEVIQQEEKIAIKHGSHIAINSNEPYAPELDLPDYKFPTLSLLEDRAMETISLDKDELEKNKTQIIQTLRSFGIEIQSIKATVGPTVTLYEIVPAEGVRISKIRNLEDDIALNLAALGIRIIAPIPGKGTIGIEVPNAHKQIVSMRTLISSDKFVNNKMSLPIALGKKIDNENYIVDLATMPHMLMAGATGQGKSVGINAILVSLLYKKHPSQLKFVMVDPKKVELSIYRIIEKHFLAQLPDEDEPIITDTKKVINTLNALCIEMDDRYELLKQAGTRNIKEYNEKFIARRLNPERGHKYLPFIVLVIDEFADLIMTAGKEVEMPIARLAQLARAIGIHLIIATQRPSVNVITGTIKANFPARIAFKVSAKVDSRTILDSGGAEQLIGRGDMLVSFGSELLRMQCAFVDTPEVEKIVEFIAQQRGYPSAFELPEYVGEDGDGGGKEVDLSNRDKFFEDCARVVVQMQSGSTSNLQRRFNLGYNRAGRIMDQLESAGIVGPAAGSKPREVYFKTEAELEQFLHSLD